MVKRKAIEIILILLLTSLSFSTIHSQELSKTAHGGKFDYSMNKTVCLSEENRTRLLTENRQVLNSLIKEGKLDRSNKMQAQPSFLWPLKPSTQLADFSYYGIANFVDHDPSYPNHLLDYNGGPRSYDLESGYNHQGTDIFPWPFAWYVMDNALVEIVAMADGTIIGKDDGNYDRNCGFNDNDWNAVYVSHDNGVVAWYGHLKNGSTTTKSVGESVFASEYLGIIGSSGSSTGPHLHLEIYDDQSNLIDPWLGQYNSTISSSWWNDQKPYYDSKVNKVASHSTWPIFPDCPQQEILNLKDVFLQGDTVYLVTYYQDQLKDQTSYFTITNPENQVSTSWSHSIEDEHYSASYWGWWFILPQNASLGTWKFSVTFEQSIYNHNFTVSNTTDVENKETVDLTFSLKQNYPNPFNPSTTIRFTIPTSHHPSPYQGEGAREGLVLLRVYNILGRQVGTLLNEKLTPGNYEVEFNGNDLSSGIYFYRLTNGNNTITKKMLLMK